MIFCWVGVATAQTPAFDPQRFKGRHAGPPTRVLVLGTPHLSQLQALARADLDPLLDKLQRHAPRIVTSEALSGPGCDALRRYEALLPDVAASYCAPTTVAERATGLTIPAAEAEIAATLQPGKAPRTPAERRRLAAVFAAAGDRASALVQWLRLPAAERRSGDGIDADLLAQLQATEARPNENVWIGAALAARLGLERVYPVDDHSADRVTARLGDDYQAALKRLWSGPNAFVEQARVQEAAFARTKDVLALYRWINLPESQLAAAGADFGAALLQQTPALHGRRYVAWWEARNLRMVANIREAAGSDPGAPVLAIVGSSHKAYFDAYLQLMHEIELVDAQAILK